MSRRDQRGISLAEALVVLGLLGMTVVALAPFETMLLRTLRDGDLSVRPAALSWPARRLAADARAAVDARIVSPTEARFTLPDGRRVVWSASGDRVLRDDGRNRRPLAGTTLRLATRGALLDATLTDADGRAHRVEVFLRHGRTDR